MKKKTKIIIGAVAAVTVLAVIGGGCNSNKNSDATNEIATVAEISSTFDTEVESTMQELLTMETQTETEFQTELVTETLESSISDIEVETETIQIQTKQESEVLAVSESKQETVTNPASNDQKQEPEVTPAPDPEPTPAPTSDSEPTPAPDPAPNPDSNSGNGDNFNTYDNPDQQNTTAQYVLNTNTMKIHVPGCKSVAKIKPHNYDTSNLSIEELEAQGYERCGICLK